MLREKTMFAHKIIDFYGDRGIECSVVDEHLSLLITLSAAGETHEFRYGNRAFAGATNWKKFYQTLERELSSLRAEASVRPERRGRFRHDRHHADCAAV
ncbi:MAG: hypothetical protein ACYC2I_06720 [Elusimicrobiales bacterium]